MTGGMALSPRKVQSSICSCTLHYMCKHLDVHMFVHVRDLGVPAEGKLCGSGAAVQGTQLLTPGKVLPPPHPTPPLPVIRGCGKSKEGPGLVGRGLERCFT